MNYIFDTNTVSFLFDASREPYHTNIRKFFSSLKDDDNLYISIVTLYELEYSLSNAPGDKKGKIQLILSKALEFFMVLPLSKEGARFFGELKSIYKKKTGASKENIKKSNVDFMIASTAIVNSCTVISYDSIFKEISEIFSTLKVKEI